MFPIAEVRFITMKMLVNVEHLLENDFVESSNSNRVCLFLNKMEALGCASTTGK